MKPGRKPQDPDPRTVEIACPDSLFGTGSHTTMANGLAVPGWGDGGIEAEACMPGQPLDDAVFPMGRLQALRVGLKEGVAATDLVLTVTRMLRKWGVEGRFVEFFVIIGRCPTGPPLPGWPR